MKPLIYRLSFSLSLAFMSISAMASAIPEVDLSNFEGDTNEYFNAMKYLETGYISAAPEKRDDGLAVASLTHQAEIIALAKDFADDKYGRYDSLLVAHKNKLVFESYFKKGAVNLPHPQASATKVYTSLAIGRAIELGYLSMEDLHKPIIRFLKNVDREKLAPGAETITLHHTLSMRSGLRFEEGAISKIMNNPDFKSGQSLAQAFLSESQAVTEETQTYLYQGSDPDLSMIVLEAVVPGSAKEFIKTELLDKLGIENYLWKEKVSGIIEAGWLSSFTSRDMLKWGVLIKQNGVWNGEPLISDEYLKIATGSVSTPVEDDWDYSKFRYGYFFWGYTAEVDGKQFDLELAWGGGSQHLIAIKELDLVIVVTGHQRPDHTLKILEERLLPHLIKNPLVDNTLSEFPAFELPSIRVIPITESSGGGKYELYVKLPKNYAETNKDYPVIYITDAKWAMEIVSAATDFILEDVILVGISWQQDMEEKSLRDIGEFASRFRDYAVKESDDPKIQEKYNLGQASRHLDFVRNDVIPHIEKTLRTDPSNRAYFGYSLGGQFGAYTLMEKPDTFKHYILGSPSVWGLTPYFAELSVNKKRLNAKVFISYGSEEEKLSKEVKKLVSMLKKKKDPSLALTHKVYEGDHSTTYPLTSVQSITWLASQLNIDKEH